MTLRFIITNMLAKGNMLVMLAEFLNNKLNIVSAKLVRLTEKKVLKVLEKFYLAFQLEIH